MDKTISDHQATHQDTEWPDGQVGGALPQDLVQHGAVRLGKLEELGGVGGQVLRGLVGGEAGALLVLGLVLLKKNIRIDLKLVSGKSSGFSL